MKSGGFPIVLGVILVLLLAPAARADLEETERRLKRAGISEPLRKKINGAIRRGARWLSALHRPDGSYPANMSTLCGLALQHAAMPEAQAAYRRTLSYILGGRDRLREGIYRSVYAGGLAALMLQAEGRQDATLRRLGKAFVIGEGNHGFWGYSNGTRKGKGAGNLSSSQFAILALRAAATAGFEPGKSIWARHARYLIRTQTLDGSFGYGTSGLSYPTGTFMGMANLTICGQALGRIPDDDLRLAVETSTARAELALARDVPAAIAAFRTGRVRDYYALFALEKVCLFLDREEFGGVRWYAEGAKALLAAQQADGHWSGRDYPYWLYGSRGYPFKDRARAGSGGRIGARDVEATAFALLFLLRAWETFHPKSPRPVEPTTTPQEPGAAPAPEPGPADADPAKVSLELADSLLVDLELGLRDPGRAAALVAILRVVGDAYTHLDAPPGDAEAWRQRAEALLLKAFAGSPRVASVAAGILGRTHSRVAKAMMRVADRTQFPRARKSRDIAIYAPVFEALAGLGTPEALKWMLDRHMIAVGSPHDEPRILAALRASTGFRNVPGSLRLAAARRLILGYAAAEVAVGSKGPPALWTGPWSRLGTAVIHAVQHFSRDADGLPPISARPTGGWVNTMAEFQAWLRDHGDPRKAPWR